MRTIIIALFSTALCLGSSLNTQETKRLITEKQKESYSIGLSIGGSFKQQGLDIDLEVLAKGIQDALEGNQPMLTEDEIRQAMLGLKQRMMEKQQAQNQEIAEKNLAEGEAFLKKNRKRQGVVELPSGLQYEVIEKGTGRHPQPDDTVVTNYRGTLISGEEFDSSYKRGKPVTFKVNGVIKGWVEALQLMKPGSKWKLYIPSDLAYGARGAGKTIEPNSTLIFEIELLEINPE